MVAGVVAGVLKGPLHSGGVGPPPGVITPSSSRPSSSSPLPRPHSSSPSPAAPPPFPPFLPFQNNKDYFDQSLDEVKLLRYINGADPGDEHGVLRLHDFFYFKVGGGGGTAGAGVVLWGYCYAGAAPRVLL